VFLVAGLFSAALGPLIVLPSETSFQFRLVRLASTVCIALLVLAWCYFDSLERRQPFHAWLRILILFFGVFALFIYLFQSRGFKQGVRSSGMALLSLAGLFAVLLASAIVSGLVFGVD
jgi:predicted ferric reductase